MAVQFREDALKAPGSGAYVAVLGAVDRLSQVIEEETLVVSSLGHVDFERLNHQKNYGLLELTRAMRVLPANEQGGHLATHLRRLRDLLAENARVLELHRHAADEIASLIASNIEDASSDGTYSAKVSRDVRR
ncbi:MAG: hypothetical protein JWL62_190 [Hyphomicrobiales bacterium]|nr:hypothetical protein [Hyphomicrobiales bacterium]